MSTAELSTYCVQGLGWLAMAQKGKGSRPATLEEWELQRESVKQQPQDTSCSRSQREARVYLTR